MKINKQILLRVIIELGQLVQEPCNFNLTIPSSYPFLKNVFNKLSYDLSQ